MKILNLNRRSVMAVNLILTIICLNSVTAEKKLGQTGFQFLSVSSDARAGAMAGAVTTTLYNSTALFFNPAGLSRMEETLDISMSRNYWIADINYLAFSGAFKPVGGRFGVVAFSISAIDYGEIQGAMRWDNLDGYILTETMNPAAISVGVGYAKSLSDQFSVGGQIKLAAQQLGKSVVPQGDSLTVIKNLAAEYAFDFGTMYRTSFKSLVFGMTVRNFSKEVKYETESFQMPLMFTMGISFDLMDFMPGDNGNSLLFAVDALHPRSYPEQLKFGLEYSFGELASLRLGYHLVSDEQKVAFGFGVNKFGLALDYAYTPFGVFDNVQRITIRFSI
ncbi:MAG: PorV/PorQ family protein [Candidatus Neomarinimicrobiota bacterium]